LALIAACISGAAVWLNAFAVKQVPDAAVYTTLKNGVAAMILLALAGAAVPRSEVRKVAPHQSVVLLLVGLLGGGLAFLLFFSGLAAASAPSAAFIQKTLFVWVAILAVPFLGERLGLAQVAALGVLAVGQAVVLPPRDIAWGQGETMILVATLIWAVEVALVRRFLRDVPTPLVAVGRLGIGLLALGGFVLATDRAAGILALPAEAWAWTLVTGLILAAYVSTWFAALRRAPATLVTSILVAGAVITGVFQAIAKGAAPAPDVVGGYVLIAIGVAAMAALAVQSTDRASVRGRAAFAPAVIDGRD
jgi:drug/metabolite transporter (DMT)-like permease